MVEPIGGIGIPGSHDALGIIPGSHDVQMECKKFMHGTESNWK